MPSRFTLNSTTRTRLQDDRLLSPGMLVLIEMIMQELLEVAEGVGRDYDEEEGDYPNLAGLMCSGRTRNRVARRIRREDLDLDLEIEALGSGSAIVLQAAGTGVHPYSTGSADTPVLTGSQTKGRILRDSQAQLELFNATGVASTPPHVVVAYSRDHSGIASAKVGVMIDKDEFDWHEPIFGGEFETGASDQPDNTAVESPRHSTQPVDEPEVRLRPVPREEDGT